MGKLWFVATVLSGLVMVGVSAEERGTEQPRAPVVPPTSGTSSSDLARSGGVITPPADVDPEMKRTPPSSGAKMPIIRSPDVPGGDSSTKPK
jgi:hypothetical protein